MYSICPSPIDDIPATVPDSPARLFDRLRRHMRDRDHAWKTEKAYLHWMRRVIRFHGKGHPRNLPTAHVEAYLSHLANGRHRAPATQVIVPNALACLFTKFLGATSPIDCP